MNRAVGFSKEKRRKKKHNYNTVKGQFINGLFATQFIRSPSAPASAFPGTNRTLPNSRRVRITFFSDRSTDSLLDV